MKWSWRIATVSGIGIYVHVTFVVLLGFFALSPLLSGQSVGLALRELLFMVTLFGIVVLHELGHAITARQFGIRTRDIVLLPIGGVARLERMPEDPKQELLVALAGPAVNIVLAVGLFAFLVPLGGLAILGGFSLMGGGLFLARLIWVNLALAAFNLLPAFPMDGGRILRAVLALTMDHVRATHIAATIGQGMAIVFGFLGLFGNPLLLFIALFVWMGAAEEASMVQMKSALGGIPISRAMITDFRILSPQDPLEKAVAYILGGFQQDFPVIHGERLVGVLTRNALITALAQKGAHGPVEEVMERRFETADPSEMLETVFERFRNCQCRTLPIIRGEELIGMVTLENLGEFMMVHSALRRVKA